MLSSSKSWNFNHFCNLRLILSFQSHFNHVFDVWFFPFETAINSLKWKSSISQLTGQSISNPHRFYYSNFPSIFHFLIHTFHSFVWLEFQQISQRSLKFSVADGNMLWVFEWGRLFPILQWGVYCPYSIGDSTIGIQYTPLSRGSISSYFLMTLVRSSGRAATTSFATSLTKVFRSFRSFESQWFKFWQD